MNTVMNMFVQAVVSWLLTTLATLTTFSALSRCVPRFSGDSRVPRLSRLRCERGDVPGWVLVTLMTAGLVVTLWAVAGPAFTDVFTRAIAKVTGAI